jgi:cytochrome c oxidase cbb3-type subunit 3
MKSRSGKFTILLFLLATLPVAAQQAEQVAQQRETLFSNTAFEVMLAIVVLLLFIIIGLAQAVQAGAARNLERAKKEKRKDHNSTIGLLLIFLLAATTAQANSVTPGNVPAIPEQSFQYWGMGAQVFYLMLIIILFEVLIATLLFHSGMQLIKSDTIKNALANKRAEPSLLEKLNASVAIHEEESILTGHEYDGIRELDNDLPPWWKYGFYLTIVVAVIYLFHFHVLHTGKLSLEEYAQEMKDGAAAVAEYQKSAVDLVDENTVKLLKDPASISEGQAIYKQNCVACHGEFGEGKEGLGPNFTDDYWLHGGSVNEIFRSVKYGWTDKGMKSWQQDLKPSEIQLVVSFLKSIRGTNPPNAKEKQGELYIEEGEKVVSDSSKTIIDSLGKPGIDSVKK